MPKIPLIFTKLQKMFNKNLQKNSKTKAGQDFRLVTLMSLMAFLLAVSCSKKKEIVREQNYQNSPYSTPYRPQYQPPQYVAPRSMNYSNPYSVPMPPQQYDGSYNNDQYYVAPRYYYNVEPEQQRFNANNRY